MKEIVYSPYQVEIFDAYDNSDDDLLIQAVAGSGKTFTIQKLSERAFGKTLFLAFNKSIAEEIKTKVPPFVHAMTLHSLGCQSIMKKFGGVKVNPSKVYKLIAKNMKKWKVPEKEKGHAFFAVNRLVDLYRLTMCKDMGQLTGVALNLGLIFTNNHLKYAEEVLGQLERYNRMPKEIDFTDMIYLPATSVRFELPKYDNVFIDECQDLNNAQHLLVDRLTKRSRVVYVGDEYQAIYGFAGANTQSFNKLRSKRGMREMPLSVCYRCPQSVVDRARRVYPIIEAFEGNGVGVVDEEGDVYDAQEGDMVICRNTKPLIEVYLRMLTDDKKAYIRGKDIGQSLIRMIKPYSGKTTFEMSQGFINELKKIEEDLKAREIKSPKKHPSYENFAEKVGIIMILAKKYPSTEGLFDLLNKMFTDDNREGVMLSTIHKAKGLEADNVYFLNKHLIPNDYATTQEQLEQEQNLKYVAITRAKQKLIYAVV